jgi:hypothetical protein
MTCKNAFSSGKEATTYLVLTLLVISFIIPASFSSFFTSPLSIIPGSIFNSPKETTENFFPFFL